MKLQHNLGGLEGLDPVEFEKRVFVEAWEKRIFGIHVAMMALSNHLSDALPAYPMKDVPTKFKDTWTWADLRKGAEGMNPFDYFKYRYYEKWLGGISSFFIEKGYITSAELQAKTADLLGNARAPKLSRKQPKIGEQVIRYLRQGDSPRREPAEAPEFAVGERVRIANIHPIDHTRLPGYLRDKTGVIDSVYEGSYTYFCSTGPDGIGTPMTVYSVRFEPQELWGESSEPGSVIYADLFQAYLLPLESA